MNKVSRLSLPCLAALVLVACSDDGSSPKPDRPRASDLFPWMTDLACAGCFNGSLCVTGNTNSACGLGGAICQVCSSTQQCQNGTCVPPATSCSASSCATGCCSETGCVTPPTTQACGTKGSACVACKANELCSGGQCAAANDCAVTCTGCCDNGSCQQGTTKAACGKNGEACVACPTGKDCVSKTCVDPATVTYKVVLKSAAIMDTGNCLPPLSACDSSVELTAGSCTKKSKYVYDNNSPVYDEVLCASLASSAITSKFSGRMMDPNSPLPEVELCTFDTPPTLNDVTGVGSFQAKCTRGALKFHVATILFEFVKN